MPQKKESRNMAPVCRPPSVRDSVERSQRKVENAASEEAEKCQRRFSAGRVSMFAVGGNVLALKRHRVAAEWKKPNEFVFCKKDGFPFDPNVLRKDVLYPILDRLGIPRPSSAATLISIGSLRNCFGA
jgi:hypothetical protein